MTTQIITFLVYTTRTSMEFAYAQKILDPYEELHVDDAPDLNGTLGLGDFLVQHARIVSSAPPLSSHPKMSVLVILSLF